MKTRGLDLIISVSTKILLAQQNTPEIFLRLIVQNVTAVNRSSV
jgi:hypothetical protein